MMTTDATSSGLSGLLPQILGGLSEGGVTEAAGDGAFAQSLAAQIKSLMLQRGDDPAEVAAIDDDTLVAEFFALLQGQDELAVGAVLGMGYLGELIGRARDASDAGEAQTDETDETDVLPDVLAPADETPAGLVSLPNVVLERLNEAGQILPAAEGAGPGTRVPQTLGAVSPPGLDRSASALWSARAAAEHPLETLPESVAQEAALDADGLPQSTGAAASRPSWLAHPLSSGNTAGTWTAAWVPALPDRDAALESAAAVASGQELGEWLERGASREPEEGVDRAPAGVIRTTTALNETTAVGARLQNLDLNRLLQPGGEARLAEQVRWSVDNGLDTAEIKLHPPSLGTLDVRIVQEGDRTHVQFVSAHPIAREVLEAAVPRLRDALAQDGVWLGTVSVSDQASGDRGETGREQGQSAGAGELGAEDDEDRIESPGTISVLSRRLDVFT